MYEDRFAAVATLGIATLYLGTLYLGRHGVVADGYDGVGFIMAVHRFDLARFQPQPPGYPLFVLAGRILHALGPRPALTLAATSALLLSAGLGALAGRLRATLGGFAALFFLLLVPTAPLCFGLGVATLSDGAGLGMLLLALVLYARGGAPALVGVLGGLALGIRPPLLPLLALGLAILYADAWRRRAACARILRTVLIALSATVLLWLLPLAYVVGPEPLVRLTLEHARGHFTDFGGSVLVDAAPAERLRAFLLGLGEGSLGRLGWLVLLGLGPGVVGLFVQRRELPGLRPALLFLGGYAGFTLFSLPVAAHGRHLLPLSVGLLTLLSMGLAALSFTPRLRVLLLAGAAMVAVDNGRAVWAFRSTPPPGAALAAHIAHATAENHVYGARAARYLELRFGSGSARPAVYLGEVLAELERVDSLPAEVLLTSEVLASPASRARLRTLARFCYPAAVPKVLRFDRAPNFASDCIELLAYRVRP